MPSVTEKPTHPRIETIGHQNDHVSFNNNNMPKDTTSTVQSQPRREPNNRSRGGSPRPRQGKTLGSSPRREPTRPDNQSKQQEVHVEGGHAGQSGRGGRGQQQQRPQQGNRRDGDKQRGQANSRPNQQSGRRRNVSEGSDKGGKGDRERTISESSTSQDPSKPKKPSKYK